jgi:hypothetical protein
LDSFPWYAWGCLLYDYQVYFLGITSREESVEGLGSNLHPLGSQTKEKKLLKGDLT